MSTYPAIWYTSGTPHNDGQRDCAMFRYLGYHAGRHGTGYRRRAIAVPLATGAAVHQGIGYLNQWILDWQGEYPGRRLSLVPDSVIAWAATEAASGYEQIARTRGLELTKTDLDAAAAIEQLILEQRTLIEGQIWIYALARLPVLLSIATLVSSEFEEGPVLDCTCGLGNWVGQWTDHLPRGCAGICAQARADGIWRLVEDRTLVYEEIKTKATQNYGWEQQWEHSGQLWINMEAASRRLGEPVSQAFVPVLFKGKRDRVDRDDKASPKIQMSPLAYGWFDPGNGMNRLPEWSARYKWSDDWGKWHTLGKSFVRKPIWDESIGLGPTNPNGVTFRAEASRVEDWVKGWILPVQWPDLLKVLGPFPKPAMLTQDAERAFLVEERRWRADVEWLRSVGLYQPSDQVMVRNLPDDDALVPMTVADVITRSWNCTRYDGTPCSFKGVCHKDPGWEQLDQHPDFEIRTPHHAIEKEALTEFVTKELGLAWTSDDDEGEAE